jgi:phage-related protein (TIGR01555 family)
MALFRAQGRAVNQVAMTTDGFDNFLSRIGLNNDNALSKGKYTFNNITRNRILLEAAYRGSWVAGVICDAVAEDMTRAGIKISTNDGKDEDMDEFKNAQSRLQIWQTLQYGISMGRLYGGAVGVLQIKGQQLSTPLDLDTIAKDQFQGIAVYDRWQLNPILQEVIDTGPDIGLPKYYDIVPGYKPEDVGTNNSGLLRVHHSRCIRFGGIKLPFSQAITENMWDESELERLWDRLIAFDNATMSSAGLIDRANLRTVGVNGLREIIAAGGEAQAGLESMFDMMRRMQTNEGLTLLDKEDTMASTAYSFAGLSDMMLQFGQQLGGASGIPLVRFFAQAPAGMNSTGDSDWQMYYGNIKAKQEAKLRNPIEILTKIMWRSVFGKPAPKDLKFTFNPLWEMTAKDKADNGKTITETILGPYEAGLVKKSTTLKELRDSSGETGLFTNISDDDIKEAEDTDDDPPMPETDPSSDPAAEKAPGLGTTVPSFDGRFNGKGKTFLSRLRGNA